MENPTDPTDTTSITYFNASTGAKSKISLDENNNNHIQIQDYIAMENNDLIHDRDTYIPIVPRELVPEAGANGNPTMYVTYNTIEFDESKGIVKVAGLKVCKVSDNTPLASFIDENRNDLVFEIRVISNDYKAIG